MIRNKDELISMISQRIGEDNSDEAIALLEDVSDTFDEYETRTKDNTDWKTKYEENDAEWRNKYKERFMSGSTEIDDDVIPEPEEKKYTFESLFTKG